MRILAIALVPTLGVALTPWASAQAQEAGRQQQEALVPQGSPGVPVYDIVAADRETAWRINRMTGEVVICRIDTTGGLDSLRARCSQAAVQGGSGQQSMAPAEAGPGDSGQ